MQESRELLLLPELVLWIFIITVVPLPVSGPPKAGKIIATYFWVSGTTMTIKILLWPHVSGRRCPRSHGCDGASVSWKKATHDILNWGIGRKAAGNIVTGARVTTCRRINETCELKVSERLRRLGRMENCLKIVPVCATGLEAVYTNLSPPHGPLQLHLRFLHITMPAVTMHKVDPLV